MNSITQAKKALEAAIAALTVYEALGATHTLLAADLLINAAKRELSAYREAKRSA